jgi:hypothetical protein
MYSLSAVVTSKACDGLRHCGFNSNPQLNQSML